MKMNDAYYDYDFDDDLSLFDRDLWGSDGDSSRYGNWGSYSHPSRNSTNANDGDDKPDAAVYVRAVLGFMVSAYLMLKIHQYHYCICKKHHTNIPLPSYYLHRLPCSYTLQPWYMTVKKIGRYQREILIEVS